MARFKKGDRVRATVSSPMRLFIKGVIYEVLDADDDKVWATNENGKRDGWGAENFELVPVAAATGTFKVGDRVRVVKDDHGCAAVGHLGTIAEISKRVGVEMDAPFDGHGESGRRWNFFSPTTELELIEDNWDYDPRTSATSTLTIEAGKFYKTRDGRKVGPMRCDRGIQGYKWDGRGTGQFYNDLGAADDGEKYDLIAEWSAGRECAAAQVDNQRDEYGPVGGAGKASNDNGKPKFKVGDRVVTKSPYSFSGARGEVVAVRVDGNPDLYKVGNIDHPHAVGASWSHRTDMMRLASESPSTPAIVALIENGQPKPSDRPHVHADRAAAEKEAARLADKHRGKEFGVYELVSTASKEPEYAQEWQRLAAGGEKIAAIKELRSHTGLISLRSAKMAVEDRLAAA